jgi:hypothetical protein
MALLWKVVTKITGPAGSPWYNSLYFHDTVGSPQDAADAAQDLWDGLKAYMHTSATFFTPTEVLVLDIPNGEVQGIEPVTQHTGSGVVSADPLPRGIQLKMKMRTGIFLSGREVKGSIFVPALCESKNSVSGEVDTATVAATAIIGNALISDANTLYGIYSVKHRAFFEAASCSVNGEWSMLRTRRD